MVIKMTHAPKIGNALYDARLQENCLQTQRTTWQTMSRMGAMDDVGSIKRPEGVVKEHRERTETGIGGELFLREVPPSASSYLWGQSSGF